MFLLFPFFSFACFLFTNAERDDDTEGGGGHKIKGLSAVPDVSSVPLRPPGRLLSLRRERSMGPTDPVLRTASDEEFLIVACDGLWDFISAEGAVECVSPFSIF